LGPGSAWIQYTTPHAHSVFLAAPAKQNCAHVVNTAAADAIKATWEQCVEGQPIKYHRSRLFWLIVVLMVIPLLLTNAVICAIVSTEIMMTIPLWIEQAGNASLELEVDALKVTASSKATLVNALVFESVRDVHLITRIAGWLAFGGVNRSDSITYMSSFSEECKLYSLNTCPILMNSTLCPCVCEWSDLNNKQCSSSSSPMESRYLQYSTYSVEARDADVMTGFRNATPSFPELGSTPNTTSFWRTIDELPGSWQGDNSSGFRTSYDRMRLASAASVAEVPVYNYRTRLNREPVRSILGAYVAFQDDGMMTGTSGCDYPGPNFAFFRSSAANGAYKINPELCPEGKWGYDPRCRDWYASGKREYEQNRLPVIITPPYVFALQDTLATSATSPIVHPETGEYVGQALIDHVQTSIIEAVTQVNTNQISILVSPNANSDAAGGSVVQSITTENWSASNTSDLLLPFDPPGSPNRMYFERSVLPNMKTSFTNVQTASFKRTMDDSSEQELLLAFAPVTQRALLPVNPSNFSRGVNTSRIHFYTIGIAVDINATHAPFQEVEDAIGNDLSTLNSIYIGLTVFVSLLFTAVACFVSTTTSNNVNVLAISLTLSSYSRPVHRSQSPLRGR
jgi:hypothetical protein